MSGENDYGPRHWKVEFTANTLIVLLILAIAVNSVLILGFQVWFVYGLDTPDEALSRYPEHTLIAAAEREHLQSWLLQAPDGTVQLVTTEKHVLADQYRVVKNGTGPVTEKTHTETIWGDSALAHITVSDCRIIESFDENSLSFRILRSPNLSIPMVFIIYSVLMMAAEIGGVLLFRKIRGVE